MNKSIIEIRDPGGNSRRLMLTGEPVSFGRDPSNSLGYNDPRLSKFHCVMEMQGESVILKDLNSRTGTFVDGKPVKELKLAGGEKINIGRIEISFQIEKRTASAKKSKQRKTSDEGSMLTRRSGGAVASLDVHDTDGTSGPVQRVQLNRNRIVIGRKADVDVMVNQPSVSRHHAELFVDPFGRWWVRDLGTPAGTYVNGKKIDEQALRVGDMIRVGQRKFRFRPADKRATSIIERKKADARGYGDNTQLRVVKKIQTPKIDTKHLARLTDFSSNLLNVEDVDERMQMLCHLMLSSAFRGRSALVVRVRRDESDIKSPTMLCEPVIAKNRSGSAAHVSGTTLRAVLENEAPVVASNDNAGTGVLEMTMVGDAVSTMSVIAVPLESNEEFMDILYVTFPSEYGTEQWQALVNLACEDFHVAQETWSARQHAQAHALIEQDLKRGHQIQMGLVPTDLKFEGLDVGLSFETCRWVGGDYLDAFDAGDNRVFLTVADVCGKGLQAALIASSLHAIVHTNVRSGFELSDLMHRLNDYLVATLPGDSFVTMVALLLDLETGVVEYVNAGHPPPFVYDMKGKVHRMPDAEDMPLGIMEGELFLIKYELEPGYLLAMCTDGLNEQHDERSGQMLGINGVGQLLGAVIGPSTDESAHSIAQKFAKRLDKINGSRLLEDDRTFLVARRL